MEFISCPLLSETIKFFFMSLLLQTEDIVVFKENPTWSLSWTGLPLSESILIISPRRLLYKELPAKETMLFWGKSFSRHSKVVSTTVFFFLYHFPRSIEMDYTGHVLSFQFCKFKKYHFVFSVMFQKWWRAFPSLKLWYYH